MHWLLRFAAIAWASAAVLPADLTYDENLVTSARGDIIPGMFDPHPVRSLFDRADYQMPSFDLNAPSTLRVYIKGHKLARVGQGVSDIYDLEQNTVTRLDWKRQTFHVFTFAEMEHEIDKGPKCHNCKVTSKENGAVAMMDGAKVREYRLASFQGKGAGVEYLAHAIYWMTPTPPSEEMSRFTQYCEDRFGPQNSQVCALTRPDGFGPIRNAVGGLSGFVVARVIEIRSRMVGMLPGRSPILHSGEESEGVEVQTGATLALVRRTETHISNVMEGPVREDLFKIPDGYRRR